jgi:hypothetical protein
VVRGDLRSARQKPQKKKPPSEEVSWSKGNFPPIYMQDVGFETTKIQCEFLYFSPHCLLWTMGSFLTQASWDRKMN